MPKFEYTLHPFIWKDTQAYFLIRNISSLLLFDSMSHVKKWQKKSYVFDAFTQQLDSAWDEISW